MRALQAGLAALTAADPALARAVEEAGAPVFDLRPPGFETLVRAIVAQQVSAASARAIFARLCAAVQPLTPMAFLAAGPEAIRACGFSRPKIAYATALAEHILDGRLPLDSLPERDDAAVVQALTAVPGIGVWSAEVYMIFAMGRPDVWPAGDLALQTAQQRLRGLEARPTPKVSRELATAWAPWRSAAAVTLWHYYRTMP
ncbi:MAG: DNA-3-methyladenine glycosylase 2 family protein [Alphaproteobacteria bacterium]|nr:DNA-3-methyladenine glycosylase 2 family protein [Alphaproteobacteria bacterium]MCB9928330.1 DNA-3-methyladenine glycosylase 2 family protein [Alphaproteobacteria bacterium]